MHTAPRGRVTTVGCAFEPTRRSTNSPASEPKTSAVLPWLFTKALREKKQTRAFHSSWYISAQHVSCHASEMASTTARRRKSAGSAAHPPARNTAPSNSLGGGMRSWETPQPRQKAPKGPPEAPPPCPRTTVTPRGWTESHRLTVWSNTATRASSPLHERPTATCHFDAGGRKARPGCWPAQSRETEPREWFSDRAHASAPRSATRGPPALAEKKFPTPLPDSFFVILSKRKK